MEVINTFKCGFSFILSYRSYYFCRNEGKSYYPVQFAPRIELRGSNLKVTAILSWSIEGIIFNSTLLKIIYERVSFYMQVIHNFPNVQCGVPCLRVVVKSMCDLEVPAFLSANIYTVCFSLFMCSAFSSGNVGLMELRCRSNLFICICST